MAIEVVGKPVNKECNKTHLDIERAEDRGIIHRDYLSHMLRWTHCIKYAKYQRTVLDIGCGTGMLAQVLYVNKFRPAYTGIDIRKKVLEEAEKRNLGNASVCLVQMDITAEKLPVPDGSQHLISCFEVVEHIPEQHLDFVLAEAERCLAAEGRLLLSTPNFNGKDKAANHLKEYTYYELKAHIEKFFTIERTQGTFASQSDIEPVLSGDERSVWEKLKGCYDSNMFSVLFAPLHPEQSRNILWILKKKEIY